MNGWGAGETHWGGYSQFMRTKAAHLLPLPPRFSTYEAMAIGTAGYTAMLCILKLVDHGVTPAHGPVLVTGATGGVGSFAVAMLSSMGYRTLACTGRKEEHAAYLESLGAAEVVDREILSGTFGLSPGQLGINRRLCATTYPHSVPLLQSAHSTPGHLAVPTSPLGCSPPLTSEM